MVLFHTPITPVKGGGESAATGEALAPIVVKELEVRRGVGITWLYLQAVSTLESPSVGTSWDWSRQRGSVMPRAW